MGAALTRSKLSGARFSFQEIVAQSCARLHRKILFGVLKKLEFEFFSMLRRPAWQARHRNTAQVARQL
jgi:hypothetical protein